MNIKNISLQHVLCVFKSNRKQILVSLPSRGCSWFNDLNNNTSVCLHFQVMWVCNVCRKKQDILTQSGEFYSTNHSPYGVPHPLTQGLPGATGPLSNGATERSVELSLSQSWQVEHLRVFQSWKIRNVDTRWQIQQNQFYGGGGGSGPTSWSMWLLSSWALMASQLITRTAPLKSDC